MCYKLASRSVSTSAAGHDERMAVRAWYLWLIVLSASACFVDFPTLREAEAICTPNENVFCRCPGGAPGTRACHDDGASFGACVTAPGTPCSASEAPPDDVAPPPVPPEAPGSKDDPPPADEPGEGGGGSSPDPTGKRDN